jgi:hypothetical protein
MFEAIFGEGKSQIERDQIGETYRGNVLFNSDKGVARCNRFCNKDRELWSLVFPTPTRRNLWNNNLHHNCSRPY